jgi:hypothetical protein
MAQNLVVNFIGNNKLSKTTAAVSADLKKFQKTTQSVSGSLNKAFGAVGLGLGVAKLAGFLKQSAKAAQEDYASKNQLALALKNTLGATDGVIKANDRWIQSTSVAVGVYDDDLRPALAAAVRATGNLSKGQDLLNLALDISAGTGKDLSTVTGALSKAYNGNNTSLKKLLPSLKEGDDVLGQLRSQFKGAAQEASKNNPYQKMAIILDQLKETIGEQLLPLIQKFSEYLSSDEGRRSLQQVANLFGGIATGVAVVGQFLIQNIALVKAVTAAVLFTVGAIKLMTIAMALYDIGTKVAVISTKALKIALIATGVGALIVGLGVLVATWMEVTTAADDADQAQEDAATNDTLARAIQNTNALRDMIYADRDKVASASADMAKSIRDALDKEINKMKSTAEKFRDAIGIAFGVRGDDENSIFNVDFLLGKLKRVANAAKGFAENLAKLRKKGADQSFINELVSMGPAQGNIAAKGLLASGGKLQEILGLRGQLFGSGAQAQAQASIAGNATYEININKAVVSAADIIREIKIYEKKLGKKFLVSP